MASLSTMGTLEEFNIDENSRSAKIEQSPVKKPEQSDNGAVSEDSPMKNGSDRAAKRRTKAQLKEELREKKVQKKQRELRRQRTRNRKYLSDDFTSIFTEKKHLLAGSGYVDDVRKDAGTVEEEIVDPNDPPVVIIEDADNVIEECVEVGSSSSSDYSPRHRSRRGGDSDSDSRPGSPYSDISHSTVYSISSETSEASSGKRSHSEQSRSATSQPRSQREPLRQSRSPAEDRKLSYTRDRYHGESPYSRLQSRESESPWRSRHESLYSAAENWSYSSAKNRPDSKTDSRVYQHESLRVSKHREASPVTPGRQHAREKQRRCRSNSPESSSHCGLASRDSIRQSQQRYSTADLYKPQSSRRRSPAANMLFESHDWSMKHGSCQSDRERSRHSSQHHVHSPAHSTGWSPDTKMDIGHRDSPATSPRSRHVMSPGITSHTRHGIAYRSRSPDDYKTSRDDQVKWTVGSDYETSQQQHSSSMMDESSEASYGCSVPVNVYEHSRVASSAARQPRPRYRSSLRVAGRPAYHAYASSYESTYACYRDWSRSSSSSELRTVGSPVWSTKPVNSGNTVESSLPAPPKPRRSRSPGERSTSSSSQDFDADVPVQSWETMGRSDLMENVDRSTSRHMSVSPGYPHVFHPGSGSKGPTDFAAKTRPHRTVPADVDSAHLRTRASYRRSEEENAPIAKRLRR